MTLRKFTNIYPRTFWIAIVDKEEDIVQLCKKFTILDITPQFDELRDKAEEEMIDALYHDSIAECRPVVLNSTAETGILCIIYKPDLFDESTAAHESVHIADYYFEITGMNSESFSDGGNEGYAYLVGWVAGCFIKVMKEHGKTK